MKRFLALLLLLTLLPAVPAMGEEKIDVPAVILEDAWVDDNFTLTFSADGAGVMIYGSAVHEGTWEYVNDLVYFHYQQYGDLTIKMTMSKRDGEYWLSSSYFSLQMKAVRERDEQEARESAKKKLHALKWNEEITLDFMSFSFEDVKIYRSMYQVIDNYPDTWTLSTVKGKKYLALYGTAKNPGNDSLLLSSIRAEVILDGQNTYKMSVYAAQKGDTYLNSWLNGKTTAKLCFIAELPDAVANSFTAAQIRFNLNNYLAGGSPKKDYEGDFFFQLSFGEAKAKAARKGPARAKTYYVYGKNKAIPRPSSYTDVTETESNTFQNMHPSSGKSYNIKSFYFHSRFDGETPLEVINVYVKGLKGDGFTVAKVDGRKSKYQNENCTFYTINKGKTPLGWIEVYGANAYDATIYIIKQ